jgi:hypothetical protein
VNVADIWVVAVAPGRRKPGYRRFPEQLTLDGQLGQQVLREARRRPSSGMCRAPLAGSSAAFGGLCGDA